MSKHVTAVRKATNDDYDVVERWLKTDFIADTGESGGSFYYNIDIIKKEYQRDKMIVLIKNNKAIAFIVEGIFCVRRSMRRAGYGRILAQHWIDRAISERKAGLLITCKPEASIAFWKAMKFTVLPSENGQIKAVRPLPHSNKLGSGVKRQLKIELLDEYGENASGKNFTTQTEYEQGRGWKLEMTYCEYLPNPDMNVSISLESDVVVSRQKVKYCNRYGLLTRQRYLGSSFECGHADG